MSPVTISAALRGPLEIFPLESVLYLILVVVGAIFVSQNKQLLWCVVVKQL